MSTLPITRSEALAAIKKAKRLDTLVARGQAHQEELISGGLRTLLGSGLSMGLGLLNGAGHGAPLFDVPLTLAAGITGHGLRLLGIFSGKPKFSEPLGTIGDVGLWTYLFATGVGMGSEHWGKGPKAASRGTMGETGGAFADRLAQIANST